MRYTGICYRAHDPKWSFLPHSGDGAALHGGRFNPKGTPALYLALTTSGAINEASQGFAYKFLPCTLCAYDIDCEDIIDLRTAADCLAQNVDPAHLACAWGEDVANRRTPASWTLVSSLIANGAAGILVPSYAVNATPDHYNLVLWKWSPDLPHKVAVYDPSGSLPKDQRSWS